jgi:glucose-6-phosphate 1-epimerase
MYHPAASLTIPERVVLDHGHGDLPRLTLHGSGGQAEMYLMGAHVTGFAPSGAAPVLWTSERSHYADGHPIRGGIPLCWPWFGPPAVNDGRPAHGVARVQPWDLLASAVLHDGRVQVRLGLAIGPAYQPWLAGSLRPELTVTVGQQLQVDLDTINDGPGAANFEDALHTYFAVGDIHQTRVEGLDGVIYVDKLDNQNQHRQQGAVTFDGETDRVYADTGQSLRLIDGARKRCIHIAKSGSASTVVWNPWIAKSAAMPDFGDDEWPGMVCVETANCLHQRRVLLPGDRHRTTVTISLSDC